MEAYEGVELLSLLIALVVPGADARCLRVSERSTASTSGRMEAGKGRERRVEVD